MECLTELEVFGYGYQSAIAMIYQFQDVVSYAIMVGTPEDFTIQTLVFNWVPQLNAYCGGTPV